MKMSNRVHGVVRKSPAPRTRWEHLFGTRTTKENSETGARREYRRATAPHKKPHTPAHNGHATPSNRGVYQHNFGFVGFLGCCFCYVRLGGFSGVWYECALLVCIWGVFVVGCGCEVGVSRLALLVEGLGG